MAFFQVNFFSPTLCFNTDINVFIPTPNSDEILNKKNSDYYHEGSRFQVLYLLHGLSANSGEWTRFSKIEYYAKKYNFIIVMPEVQRSFYCDSISGPRYFTYIADELPKICE